MTTFRILAKPINIMDGCAYSVAFVTIINFVQVYLIILRILSWITIQRIDCFMDFRIIGRYLQCCIINTITMNSGSQNCLYINIFLFHHRFYYYYYHRHRVRDNG